MLARIGLLFSSPWHDDSMVEGPVIYDNCKHQVNVYGETRVYKRDCGQLVPKPATATKTKTDWREGSAGRSAKARKQASQQQMTVDSVMGRAWSKSGDVDFAIQDLLQDRHIRTSRPCSGSRAVSLQVKGSHPSGQGQAAHCA